MFEQQRLKRIYRLWAPIYDLVYNAPLAAARAFAVGAIPENSRVLDVGIGTGLSLDCYPRGCSVTGIDLSLPMLKKAQCKLRRGHLPSRHSSPLSGLAVMDACRLGFDDGAFDAVVATFVVGIVPDPQRALDEMARVLKPGGHLIIANRFYADSLMSRIMEYVFGWLTLRMGWGFGLKLSDMASWAEKRGIGWVQEDRFLPAGLVRVVHLRRKGQEPERISLFSFLQRREGAQRLAEINSRA